MDKLSNFLSEAEVKKISKFFQHQIERQYVVVSIISLRPSGDTTFEQLQQMLLKTARANNLYFVLADNVMGILLYESTQKEAQFYLKRLERDFPQVSWQATICELRQGVEDFDVIKAELLGQLPTSAVPFDKNSSQRFSRRQKMMKKISIVESNEVARHMLQNAIRNIQLPKLRCKHFQMAKLF